MNGYALSKLLELTEYEVRRRFGGQYSRRSLSHFRRGPGFLIENVQHLLDRLNPRGRFFGEWKRKGHSTDQLAVHVNGTSAHARDHTGTVPRATRSPHPNH